MNATTLVDLEAQGFTLTAKGDQLDVKNNPTAFTEEVKAAIKASKPQLISQLHWRDLKERLPALTPRVRLLRWIDVSFAEEWVSGPAADFNVILENAEKAGHTPLRVIDMVADKELWTAKGIGEMMPDRTLEARAWYTTVVKGFSRVKEDDAVPLEALLADAGMVMSLWGYGFPTDTDADITQRLGQAKDSTLALYERYGASAVRASYIKQWFKLWREYGDLRSSQKGLWSLARPGKDGKTTSDLYPEVQALLIRRQVCVWALCFLETLEQKTDQIAVTSWLDEITRNNKGTP